MSDAVRPCDVLRIDAGLTERATDALAVEAPLEIRLDGEPFAVIMRTPGADTDLVTGFLLTEGIIERASDVGGIAPADDGAAIDVRLAGAVATRLPEWLASRRQVTMNSSCGLCGRSTLASLDRGLARIDANWRLPAAVLFRMPDALGQTQHAFAATGGLHAAGLFECDGRLAAMAEDVGRHNAVDKLLGRMLRAERWPLHSTVLFVSGRLSFEIVQKAQIGGIPIVGAVSAPSSLAVDLARQAGMTLAGFVRGGRCNVYSHPERIDGP
jgi:FdhD protein